MDDRSNEDRGPDSQKFMTPKQIATILNIDEATACRWAKEGKLPAVALPNGGVGVRQRWRFQWGKVKVALGI
ncbi:MAG: helix-turn-helix domain-containing protein [Ktedonobacteraceae bacterium]|nr:helix-turn-helix domain-containing protein [Ktedonobacteraceae bacterium]